MVYSAILFASRETLCCSSVGVTDERVWIRAYVKSLCVKTMDSLRAIQSTRYTQPNIIILKILSENQNESRKTPRCGRDYIDMQCTRDATDRWTSTSAPAVYGSGVCDIQRVVCVKMVISDLDRYVVRRSAGVRFSIHTARSVCITRLTTTIDHAGKRARTLADTHHTWFTDR